jgi:hypothetical protein
MAVRWQVRCLYCLWRKEGDSMLALSADALEHDTMCPHSRTDGAA